MQGKSAARMALFGLTILTGALVLQAQDAAGVKAQNPAEIGPAQALEQAPGQPPAVPASMPTAEADKLMAQTSARYYNMGRAGLAGFDCAVHPDWRWLFLQALPGQAIADDDPRVVLLKGVKVELHAQLKSGATVVWEPPAGAGKDDKDLADLLTHMQQGATQALKGFVQFWTPFVDGSAVPASAAGMTATKTDKGFELRGESGGARVTEGFSGDGTLESFLVEMQGATIEFHPRYTALPDGLLLVDHFRGSVQHTGASAGQQQELRAGVDYQTIGGFPIPARLELDVAGQGAFHVTLDECRVSRSE